MSAPAAVRDSTLELLTWLAVRPRTYRETMEAWRTSCPRLSVWEDAVAAQARESLFEGVSMHWMHKWTDGFPAFVAEASGAGFADVAGSSTATSGSGTPAR